MTQTMSQRQRARDRQVFHSSAGPWPGHPLLAQHPEVIVYSCQSGIVKKKKKKGTSQESWTDFRESGFRERRRAKGEVSSRFQRPLTLGAVVPLCWVTTRTLA